MRRLRMCNSLRQYSIESSSLVNNNAKDTHEESKTRRVLRFDDIEYGVLVGFLGDSKLFFDIALIGVLSKTIFSCRSTKELDTLP